jgi:hypothetical protein
MKLHTVFVERACLNGFEGSGSLAKLFHSVHLGQNDFYSIFYGKLIRCNMFSFCYEAAKLIFHGQLIMCKNSYNGLSLLHCRQIFPLLQANGTVLSAELPA